MLLVDLKPLVGRLDGYCKEALENAVGLCVARGHYEITIEHLVHRLLDEPQADMPLLLRQNGVDAGLLRQAVEHELEAMRSGNAGRPAFSPLLLELLQDAWLLGSVDLGQSLIRSGSVLVALIARASLYAGGGIGKVLQPLAKDALLAQFPSVCAGSIEAGNASAAQPGESQAATAAAGGAIARFCEDFTAKAREGRIDPVFGRDAEIRQMVDILARRRKNNPICVGDPGVGKTAVVEGLALRIVEGDVPDMLKEVRLLGLDMGMLQAGASVKGEFENRLKGVIDEVKSSATPIILFIDEAHTLIGAGGQAGTSDAANLLKPALARGELRTIAATTWAEYKKYFEKDAALARRFQLVKLDEPDAGTAVLILRGLRERYQEVHGIAIRDDALVAAAELSSRYISGRQLPDKAVDLLDTACARVKVMQNAKPDRLEDDERRMQALEREKRGLLQDADNRQPVDAQRLADIDAELAALSDKTEALRAHWQAQRGAAQALVAARAAFAAARQEGASDATALQALEGAVAQAEEAFAKSQDGEALVRVDVDRDVVAKVVSDWTGVPVGKMQRDRAAIALGLADALKRRIRGQDAALDQVAQIVKTASSGLNDPRQPLGVFLLVGPSGVGKTETALAVADLLFGDEKSTVVVNMSEFQERHNVSRLIGSPPGYVGYGEGGLLTEAVRQRPYSVVLLDEVEKAHLDVLNLFYQVFDKGMLSDGEGKDIDFANTVIFLTSNLATDVITEMTRDGEQPDPAVLAAAIRPLLSNHFKPALLARMTIVPYATLGADALGGIVRLKLQRIVERLARNNKMRFSYAEEVVERIAARCTEVETGARNIDFILRGSVLPLMSQQILERMGSGESPGAVHLDVDAQGEFVIGFPVEAQA